MIIKVLDRRFKNPDKIKEIKKLALKKFNSKIYSRLPQLYNYAGGVVFDVDYQRCTVIVEIKKSVRRKKK